MSGKDQSVSEMIYVPVLDKLYYGSMKVGLLLSVKDAEKQIVRKEKSIDVVNVFASTSYLDQK